jgi:hypothetical protein
MAGMSGAVVLTVSVERHYDFARAAASGLQCRRLPGVATMALDAAPSTTAARTPAEEQIEDDHQQRPSSYLLGRATLPVATAVAVVLRAFVAAGITVTVAAPLITCPCTFDTRTLNRAPLSPRAAEARV